MASAGAISAAILDPSTLPQVAFARADDLLSSAAQLRAKAESLKARAIESENKAKLFEDSAAELQASAEEDREYVQAELDSTLEYHSDVLEHFLLTPDNAKEVESLTASVEEGRAYVHEVVALGEKLLQLKAAKLQSSQQGKKTSLIVPSETEDSKASGSRIPSWILARLRPLSSSMPSTAPWQTRFRSLLEGRVIDVGHLTYTSLIQPESSENSVEAQKEIHGALGKVETRDGQGLEKRNTGEASSARSNTSEKSLSADVLQNATLPVPGTNASVEAGAKDQKKRKQKDAAVEGSAISSQEVFQSHVEKDLIQLEHSVTDSPASKRLKTETTDSEIPVQDAKRHKKVPKPTTKEKAAAVNGKKTLARYRELVASGMGKDVAKGMLKREMKANIENSNQIPRERKARLVEYGQSEINSLINREKEGRAEGVVKKGSKRKGEAGAKRKNALEVTIEEKAAFFNEPETLARYRELFASAKGTDWDKSKKAKDVIKREMNGKIGKDKNISESKKQTFLLYARQEINAMARRETKRVEEAHSEDPPPAEMYQLAQISDPPADEAVVEAENGREESEQLETFYPAQLWDELADNAVMESEGEHRGYAQLKDLYAAELSDESADEAMWP